MDLRCPLLAVLLAATLAFDEKTYLPRRIGAKPLPAFI